MVYYRACSFTGSSCWASAGIWFHRAGDDLWFLLVCRVIGCGLTKLSRNEADICGEMECVFTTAMASLSGKP